MNDKQDTPTTRSIDGRSAWIAVLVFYLVLILLNGKGIYQKTSEMEYGRERDLMLRALAPLRDVAEFTGLSSLRDSMREFAGNWLESAD